jgi:hypothetical protein
MSETRIKLTDNAMSAIMKMSEGNPGAMNVLTNILSPETNKIDPDNIIGGIGVLLSLDTHGIYGADIYILYNDICRNDMVKMLAVLRAVQLGFFSENILKDACHRQDRSGVDMIPVNDLYVKVKEELPNFNSSTDEV